MNRLIRLAAFLAPLFLACAEASGADLKIEGGALVLTLDDGRRMEGRSLTGAALVLKTHEGERKVQIDGIDVVDTPSGSVLLYRLSTKVPGQVEAQNLCLADAQGRRAGTPVMRSRSLDFTCTSGAEGKCILLGYHPWREHPGIPMSDLHTACIHMIRADYGGMNHPTTRDGTMIDVYDRFGLQKSNGADLMPFEAGWGKLGATCVAHLRIARNTTFQDLEEKHGRLKGRLGPNLCSEAIAMDDPDTLLFNRSKVDP